MMKLSVDENPGLAARYGIRVWSFCWLRFSGSHRPPSPSRRRRPAGSWATRAGTTKVLSGIVSMMLGAASSSGFGPRRPLTAVTTRKLKCSTSQLSYSSSVPSGRRIFGWSGRWPILPTSIERSASSTGPRFYTREWRFSWRRRSALRMSSWALLSPTRRRRWPVRGNMVGRRISISVRS